MPPQLLKRRRFLEDYSETVRYLAELNILTADRFCDAVEGALEMLARHPEVGRKAGFLNAPEVRVWPVRQFSQYLVFYRVMGNSIVLLRLLHGARDLPPLIPKSNS